MWRRMNGLLSVKENKTSLPISRNDTSDAVTVVINNGIRVVKVRSSMRISSTKIAPAIGASKIPAMAPAAPQPIIRVVVL